MNLKKNIVLLLISLLFPWILMAQKQHPQNYYLLIGTYTNDGSKGIYTYQFNAQTGKTAYQEVVQTKNPSYLAISADKKYVYAVNESHNAAGDSVTAFRFNDHTGKLSFINTKATFGTDPCYVSVDHNNHDLFVANYSSGSLTVFPLNANGSIGDTLQTIHHPGGGPDTARQRSAHVHAVVLSPDEKYLMADDLGTDAVYEYVYRPTNLKEPIVPAAWPKVGVKAGTGPRHIIFSKNGKHAYLTQEMGALITVFDYHNGRLATLQTIPMETTAFTGQNGAADLHLSPSGKFLYATNRGQANDIVVYKVDQQTGKLTFVQRQPCMGNGPRNFAIDPTGKFLMIANQLSNDIFTFRINQTTGKLSATGAKITMSHPVCLKFVAMK